MSIVVNDTFGVVAAGVLRVTVFVVVPTVAVPL
jgi:hypothetical protein